MRISFDDGTILRRHRGALPTGRTLWGQVAVVANFQPRKMCGIESQGMALAADLDGKAVLSLPDNAAPVGSKVR